MAYQALYRKFRPSSFDSIIGQEHIVRTLKNQLASGRVSHAYLFCGTRGTGKTSTAKIFAKAINCQDPQNGEPCGNCELCKAIAQGRSMNVIEIDAASNNGVDNIREIREEVKYPPAEGKYKVYIIDEVHMLSAGAFNALLKTLEEPPAHIIFILATTDPQKVPATILSRCQRFDFRRISGEKTVETLQGYLKEEGVQAEEKALRYIARLSDGSMRDALSILDQCMAFYFNEEITLDKVLDILGAVDNSVFFAMAEALKRQDATSAMNLVDNIMIQGRDVGQFVTDMTSHFRNLLVASSVPDPGSVLDMSAEAAEELVKQSKELAREEIIYFIQMFSQLSGQIKYADNERIVLEVALLKLCSPLKAENYEALAAKVAGLERAISEGQFVQASTPVHEAVTEKPVIKKESPKPQKAIAPEDIKMILDSWKEIAGAIDKKESPMTRATLLQSVPEYLGDGRITVNCENIAMERILRERVHIVEKAIEDKFQKKVELMFVVKGKSEQKGTKQNLEEEQAIVSHVKDLFDIAEIKD